MEDIDSSASLSSLICQEDITLDDTGDNEDHDDGQQYEACKHPPYEDEYIEMLVSRECSFESRSCHESFDNVDWFRLARLESVRWILRMKACFGFGEQTAYLAVSYFDRFLTRRTIDKGNAWVLRLLSMACLSLAAKIEELRPPTLSEFQTEGLYHFDRATIQRMELLVLSTLEWRLSSVTPFAYLVHFSLKLQAHVGVVDSLFSRATWFILAIMRVMNLVDCRPSAIATAAILAASGEVLTKKSLESKISILAFESLEAEHVFHCYNMMIQETQKESLKPTNNLFSSDVSINSSVDVLKPSSSFKRREGCYRINRSIEPVERFCNLSRGLDFEFSRRSFPKVSVKGQDEKIK